MAAFKYFIYDIESITDKALLQKVLYPELEGQAEEAYQKHLSELAEEGRDFVNPAFHQPISLAAIAVDQDYEIVKIGLLGKEEKSTASIVNHFWETYKEKQPVLVDFNGKGFDLRLLELWAFRLGIEIGSGFFGKFGPRYKFSDDAHLDLHEFLSNYGAIRYRGGLNLFSKILGKPGKMETQGHMVQELYDQEKFFEIDDYCLSDAMDTYFVFLRTQVMLGKLPLEREQALVESAKAKLEEKNQAEGYFGDYLKHFSYWEERLD
ncbi:MAG: 3'-5' exonuclease [Deltaproteobacteria bacterium]|nr:3'-5' exonuclease [Deltaproteobacteria bacterium]